MSKAKPALWTVPQKLSYFIRSPSKGQYEVVLRLNGNVKADVTLITTTSLEHAEVFAAKLKLIDETVAVTQ